MIDSMLRFIRYIFLCTAVLTVSACLETDELSKGGTVTLSLSLSAPAYGIEMKSVSLDPTNPENWTAWERAVDGRYLYRVTAFILQGSRLVTHKDLSLQNEQTEALLDFEANFTHGTYTLMVVANYSAHQADDGSNGIKTYSGLEDFCGTIEEILSHTDINSFTDTYADSFLNYTISSEGGVCKRVPQPLTLVKEIELHPGTNFISGELIRTYSRVRIEAENNSDEQLFVTSLNFSNIFTQQKAYIFGSKGYLSARSAINSGSTDALTPFIGTEDSPVIIPAKGRKVIFDAYVLESRKTSFNETYSYTLGLDYDNNQNTYTLNSAASINKTANITTGHYLIYSRAGSRYLKAGNSSVETPSNTLGTLIQGMTIPEEFVWSFDNTGLGTNQYYIGTANGLESGQTSYYMNTPNSRSVGLDSNKSVYFTIGERNSYLTFACSGGSSLYRYLYYNNNTIRGYSRDNTNNSQFLLYPVTVPRASSVEIPVRTINPITGQAEDVEYINRNDFINAVVKISYSKNQGHFSYVVEQWSSAGGDVSFN